MSETGSTEWHLLNVVRKLLADRHAQAKVRMMVLDRLDQIRGNAFLVEALGADWQWPDDLDAEGDDDAA